MVDMPLTKPNHIYLIYMSKEDLALNNLEWLTCHKPIQTKSYILNIYISIKENGLKLTKKRSRKYPAKTITNADYTDDIAILANSPAQAETLLHSLERADTGIGLYVNAHKTEYMCFNPY